ncbi:PilW family protein [Pseudomonas parafulva]|uniref:Pilus assembly protein PilW n=1 Tax=Pseudomonas parafulva TaxID=157782 RepID=A0ABN4Y3S5_9PSED|nr:pilus assembly protein PilW [Pseudomonas parafulva]AQW70024.1 pilus assembly protein PilW [Pseudomonas parafulva]
MRLRQNGVGLLELLLALALGLMLLAGAGQLFTSAHRAWQLQAAALRMQEDARLALLRMAQDVRMAGMFGCLRLEPADLPDGDTLAAFSRPLEVEESSLTVVVADLPGHSLKPQWTLLTDCVGYAKVHRGHVHAVAPLMAIPITRHRYAVRDDTLYFTRGSSTQPLLEHVRRLHVVAADDGQRIDLHLNLFDPLLALEQQYVVSVARRNGGEP